MQVIHIKQPKRKTYSLQFDHEGNLIVKTDSTYFKSHVDKILEKHKSWIKKHFREIKTNINIFKKDYLVDGSVFSVLGKSLTLKYIYKNNIDFDYSIEIQEKKILITINSKARVSKKMLKEDLRNFFREYARSYITKRVNFYTKKYNLNYNRIFIKNQRSKWGSCSSSKNLNFNWHLIFAPKNVIDYVVIHEITHLQHMDHSKKFWDLLGKRCKNIEIKKKWLRENENLIYFLK